MIVKLIIIVGRHIFELIVPLNLLCAHLKVDLSSLTAKPLKYIPDFSPLSKDPKSIAPLARMTIFFLHCMFRCLLGPL